MRTLQPRELQECSFEGCMNSVWAREWCRVHYNRWYKYGDPTADRRHLRQKAICHPEKWVHAGGLCDACYQRPRHQERHLWIAYGMRPDEYARLLAEQRNRCASCGDEFGSDGRRSTPTVDHDHRCCPGRRSCGQCVRALLCRLCNQAAGQVRDDPDRALALAAYLIRTRQTEDV